MARQHGLQAARHQEVSIFDYLNRMTGATVGGVASTSTYNGDGLRMTHTASGLTANYVWDVNRSLPQVLQDSTNKYVYGLDLISATDNSGNTTYFTTDGLGSTTDLTNSSGAVTGSYTYDVFGAATHSPGSSANPWQFTGEQTDADSGMQYLRARYYDPMTGRFLSKDPIMAAEPYAYVGNNPVNWVDPRGLASEGPGMGAYIGAVGAACVAGTVTGPGNTVICGGSAIGVIVIIGGVAVCVAACETVTEGIGNAIKDSCSWVRLCAKEASAPDYAPDLGNGFPPEGWKW